MIDIRKLKELVKLMVANDLAEMDLRDTDEQVTIRRHGETFVTSAPAAPAVAAPPQAVCGSLLPMLVTADDRPTQRPGPCQ